MAEGSNFDDRGLVRRFKQTGDPKCFAALFDRYGGRLYSLACRFHGNRSQAEDCVQETFRRALEEIQRFDEACHDSSFWAWLATIAKRVCLDELRRAKRREGAAADLRRNLNGHGELTQFERAAVSEIREELGRLDPDCRLCYLLSQVEGYSYREIMELTGYSFQQVKTRIQTARRRIERRFQ